MTTTLIVALVTILTGFVATILSNLKDLKDKRACAAAVGLIAVGFIAAATAGWQAWLQAEQVRLQAEQAKRLEVAADEPTISEASGGALGPNGVAYVVDDDRPEVFVLTMAPDASHYAPSKSFPLRGRDGKPLTDKQVDNLEGAAVFNNRLYLVTSHSRNQDNEERARRKRFLQVSLDPQSLGVVHKAVNLRPHLMRAFESPAAVLKKLADPAQDRPALDGHAVKTIVEIEGLAIEPTTGDVFLGLRAPLATNRRAIVLQARLADILDLPSATHDDKDEDASLPADQPSMFRAHLLDFAGSKANGVVGVTALEFDPERPGRLCMLTNHTSRNQAEYASTWCWRPCDDGSIQTPKQVARDFFDPQRYRAKPEVLLLPPGRRLMITFIDAQGVGGQTSHPLDKLDWATVAPSPACEQRPPARR